jgi:biotin-(acetyl-CoA carboxylase) ligase
VEPVVGTPFEGTADDIDLRGALLVRRNDGSQVTVEAGDVSLRHA